MRTPEEARPSRWRRGRTIGAALTLGAGLLLAGSLSASPAGAAVNPQTLSKCYTGTNNTVEYYTWCNGTGPTSYRSLVYCADGEVVMGVERWDGDNRESYASCTDDGLNSTLVENWGILLCSNDNGAGTYAGYQNRHGDISQFLQYWGSGNITTGGTWACDYDTSGTPDINADEPEIVRAGTSS